MMNERTSANKMWPRMKGGDTMGWWNDGGVDRHGRLTGERGWRLWEPEIYDKHPRRLLGKKGTTLRSHRKGKS